MDHRTTWKSPDAHVEELMEELANEKRLRAEAQDLLTRFMEWKTTVQELLPDGLFRDLQEFAERTRRSG